VRFRGEILIGLLGLAAGCSSSTEPVEEASRIEAPPGEPGSEERGPVARACYLDEEAARSTPPKSFKPPTAKYLGRCSKKTIEDLLVCTHKSDAEAPNDPHCQALVPEKACLACLFNDRGAILDVKFPNVPGCVALATGDTRVDGCGGAYNDWQACQKAGCASCFSKVAVPEADQDACVKEATANVCNAKASLDVCGDLDAVPEYKEVCVQQGAGLTDEYLGRFYNYFCGTQGNF
jgi:hypothetical protein